MDLVALGFYALVCGVLSLAGPVLGTPILRFGIGAVVAISKPDTGMPAKDTERHHSIAGVGFWR